MLNWFDESPDRLARCIQQTHSLGATHVVAVDGGYELFPGARRSSSVEEAQEIEDTAHELGMGFVLYTPPSVWIGNEVEKRQALIDLCLAITDESDWLLLWDADFTLDSEPVDLKPILGRYTRSGSQFSRWGDVLLTDSPHDAGWYPVRILYRALRGMYLMTNHYVYHYPDGEQTVMNNPQGEDKDRGLDLPVRIRHRPHDRQSGRRQRQVDYYEARHRLGIES